MPYSLDLNCITLQEYRELLKKQNLLPSRRILFQDVDANFSKIAGQGIGNMAQLKKALSTPEKLAAFAASSGISEEYLNILRRETGSLEQKPVPLSHFPGMDAARVSTLNKEGIKTSKDCWEKQTVQDELYSLCDLVRINGVGPMAAKAFFEAGYTSVADVAQANAEDMLRRISVVNQAKQYYKAVLGAKDMQFCIDYAKLLRLYGA